MRTRFGFGLSAIALLLTALCVALVTRMIVNAVLASEWRAFRRPALYLTFAGALIAFAAAFAGQIGGPPQDTLAFFFTRGGIDPGRRIELLIATLNAVTTAVTVLLAVGFSLLSSPVATTDRTLHELANRLSMLKALLFLASACLVTRVVQVYALYAWPASQLSPAAAADNIALSTSAANGVIYSLFLASLYLPAAALLANRLREIRVEEAEKSKLQPGAGGPSPLTVEQILACYGAPGGSVKDFGRVLAVLSPVLVGVLQGPILAVVQKVVSGTGQ